MDESLQESPAAAPTTLEEPAEPVGTPDSRRRGWALPAILIPVVIVVLIVAAWAVDTSRGGVPRNVRLAGMTIGGLSEDELSARLAVAAEDFATTRVEIVAGDATYQTTALELGLTVNRDLTVTSALDIASHGFVLWRPIDWVASFINSREAPWIFQVSDEQVAAAIIELEGDARMPPVEPSVEVVDGALHVTPGRDGRGIDPAQLGAALPGAAADTPAGRAIRVKVTPGPIPPLGGASEARAAVSGAEARIGEPIEVQTVEGSRAIEPGELRDWLMLVSHFDGTVTAELDPARVAAGLQAKFADIDDGPVDARFSVKDGTPVILPDRPGRICCGADSAAVIDGALRNDLHRVRLDLVEGPAAFTVADARKLGIREAIGGSHAWRDGTATTAGHGFTTYHAASGARVVNIHRIADLVRGAVIPPGETFSVNDHVGKRTLARGFVYAGAISNGEHVDEIGGGISQFATTAFNAAFFAGLDIDEYQAHSEYFDRYPFGREATMGFPAPDLKITNNTPYGVLIWPSYTNTSLTVTLYSTPYAMGEQTAITEGTSGNCRIVTTTRTRTFPDGSTDTDKFRARYRPGPGQRC
ncbi:MAG: VanW family protein [Acidimicrobiales bacterium]